MKKLLFLTVPLALVGAIALSGNGVEAVFADDENPHANYHAEIGDNTPSVNGHIGGYVRPDFGGSDLKDPIYHFPIDKITVLPKYQYSDIPSSGELEGKYSQFEDIAGVTSYIGFGYNILKSRYINKYDVLKTNPIFNIDQLKNTTLLLDKEYSFSASTCSESTMQDFSERYNLGLKVRGNYGPVFSGGLEMDYKGSSESKTYYHFFKGVVNIKTFSLTMHEQNSDLRGMLASDFADDLYNLEPSDFFHKYGTHFIKDIVMGGRLELNNTYYSEQKVNTDEINAAVEAHVNYMGSCIGVQASGGYSSTISTSSVMDSQNVFYVGGDLYPMSGCDSVKTYFDRWVDSFKQDLSYSSLVDVPNYQSLVPLWELVSPDNYSRRNQLENYFIEQAQLSNENLCGQFTVTSAYDVTVEHEDGGEAYGSGTFKKGKYATVMAYPNRKYDFKGWYDENGTCLSTDRQYSFPVTRDIKLTAKFNQVILMQGSGTVADPYLITTHDDFMQIPHDLLGSYKLTKDLNFGGYEFGPLPGVFNGTFDGNNKTISNFKMTRTYNGGSGIKRLGIFDEIGYYGFVFNLKINNCRISADQTQGDNTTLSAGLVCSYNYGKITNVDCKATTVESNTKSSFIGTIAGYSKGVIEDCNLEAVKVMGKDIVGGIAGTLDQGSRTENCTVCDDGWGIWGTKTLIRLTAGTLAGLTYAAGGICGYGYDNIIKNCAVTYTKFELKGDTVRNPALGYFVGYLSYGKIYYKKNQGNIDKSTVDKNYKTYYFANNSGYIGRVTGNIVFQKD